MSDLSLMKVNLASSLSFAVTICFPLSIIYFIPLKLYYLAQLLLTCPSIFARSLLVFRTFAANKSLGCDQQTFQGKNLAYKVGNQQPSNYIHFHVILFQTNIVILYTISKQSICDRNY